MYFVCFKTISLDRFVFWWPLFGRLLFVTCSSLNIRSKPMMQLRRREQLLRVSCKVYGIRVPATPLLNGLNDVAEGTCARGPWPHSLCRAATDRDEQKRAEASENNDGNTTTISSIPTPSIQVSDNLQHFCDAKVKRLHLKRLGRPLKH